jgi:hypothetical protein
LLALCFARNLNNVDTTMHNQLIKESLMFENKIKYYTLGLKFQFVLKDVDFEKGLTINSFKIITNVSG